MATFGLLAGCGGGQSKPSAPTAVTVVGGDSEATVSWTGPSNADSYNIYWATTAGVTTATGTKIAGVTSPYVHGGLTNGQSYYYIVTAVNEAGEGKPSAEVSVALTPAAPQAVSALAGDAEVTLDWQEVFGATSYNLYWSTTPGVTKANGTKIENVSARYVHTGRTNLTTYYYVVTAVGAGGESAESEQVSARPQVPAPGAPLDFTAVATPETVKSVTLQWAAPSSGTVESYNLYRSETPGIVPGVTVAVMTAGVSSPHIDLVPAGQTPYYYVVTAVAPGGAESQPSVEVSVTTKGSPKVGVGDTGYGNNLSNPLVFADGIGVTGGVITGTDYTDLATGLRPTAADVTDPFPYLDPTTVFNLGGVDYFKQKTKSTWQASWINGKSTPQHVVAAFGDNLVSAALSTNQVIRVETVLTQAKGSTSWPDTEAMTGYEMALLYGQGIGEMWGTTGNTVDATVRRVFAVTARLKIQKLVGGVPTDHACGFNGSIAEGLALPDGTQEAKYSSEINVGGSQTYGFNWFINRCASSDKAGTYRITFSFDDSVTVGGETINNNTFIDAVTGAAVRVDDKTAYIDVIVN